MLLPGFTFDGQHSDDFDLNVLGIRRTALPTSRDVFVEVPGRPGSYHFPEEPGDRAIVALVGVEADDGPDLVDRVRDVAHWVKTSSRRVLLLDEDPDNYLMAVVVNPGDVDNLLDLGRWEIEFSCGPHVYSVSQHSASAVMPTNPLTATNDGPLETPPRIVVAATQGGAVDGPEVHLGDATMLWNSALLAGQALVIDSDLQVVTFHSSIGTLLAGDYDPSTGTVPTGLSGDFGGLEPGANPITFTPDSGAATVAVFWHERRY